MKLNENLYKNRGFVLDGYPKTYNDCKNLFLLHNTNHPEEVVFNKDLFPDHFFILSDIPDDILKTRAKQMNDPTLYGTRYADDNTKKRIEIYKTLNESTKGEPSVKDFFKENHKVINQLDGRLNELELANQVKFIVENEIIGKELNKIDNDFEKINLLISI